MGSHKTAVEVRGKFFAAVGEYLARQSEIAANSIADENFARVREADAALL